MYYTPKMSLSRRTDGVGGWLVLFSFCLTVNIFVGRKTVLFESGDALIFVGKTVLHGVDDTLDQRMSLQARQH